jgi:hypothetical protein
MNRLRCFVAMRFGDPQTDQVYDRLIAPVLGQLRTIPVRVDRINHNENIDVKIIQELKICDFAVADLTFARPSVYFEAGFAQGRAVPVIYTCREDHLGRPNPDDTYGNFRVHFDLLMRNIIPWENARDSGFKKKLKARITKVIRPLVRDQKEIEAKRKASDTFSRLPMADRRSRLNRLAHTRLSSTPFRAIEHENFSFYVAKSHGKQTVVQLDLFTSLSKKEIGREYSGVQMRFLRFATRPHGHEVAKPIHFRAHWVICTFKKLPSHRVHEVLPYLSQSTESFAGVSKYSEGSNADDNDENLTIHILDDIESEEDFIEKLNFVVREILKRQIPGNLEARLRKAKARATLQRRGE